MDFIKNNYMQSPFPIVGYFQKLNEPDRESANKMFRATIHNILGFKNCTRNEGIRFFAKEMKDNRFSVTLFLEKRKIT